MSNTTAWEGAAASVQYTVYLGTWTNWSRGRILGATLTTSRANGNYILSFTAFFISLVSVRCWRILCFLIHSRLSTPIPRDALHHQRQAILRNSGSATSDLWTLVLVVWVWRRTAVRLLARMMPLIGTATFCAIAFTIAGGFSSQISTGISNEALLDGSNCGITTVGTDISSITSDVAAFYVANQALNANNYAQQCYSANTSHTFDCTSFVNPTLPSTVDYNAPCPFEQGICRSENANIRLDTGYIDTSKHLGINAPANERILFRSIFDCAPLETRNHSENVTLPGGGNYTRYSYGQGISYAANFTYEAPIFTPEYNQASIEPFSGRGREFALA